MAESEAEVQLGYGAEACRIEHGGELGAVAFPKMGSGGTLGWEK